MSLHAQVASRGADVQDPPLDVSRRHRSGAIVLTNAHRRAADTRITGRTGEVLVVLLIAVAARLPFLSHIPQRDELNHVLAARALLETGTLEIVPGGISLSRGWGFTYLVAAMFRLFGESLIVGRLPALLFGALLVAILFLWVRSEAGRLGAWFAAMLLTFSPLSLQLSQWVRFYTLYALLFLVICLLVYRLFSPPTVTPRQGMLLAFAAVVILYGVEPLTGTGTIVIGVAGLGLWIAVIGATMLFRLLPSRRARILLTAGLLVLVMAVVGIAFERGFVDWLVFGASYVDLWAESERYNFLFYHDFFLKQYPVLWASLPLAVLVTVVSRSRAAMLCLCVFVVAFLAHSIVASKAARYIFYVLPMFFALWGIALGRAVPWLYSQLQDRYAVMSRPSYLRASKAIGITVLAALVLYPAVGRPALKYGWSTLKTGEAEWSGWGGYHNHSDWVAAGTALAPWVAQADVVIGSYDVTPFYALGRLDYMMRRHYVPEEGILREFGRAGRLSVPVISTPESLSRVMACNASGLVFVEREDSRREVFGIPVLIEYLNAHAVKVELPEEWKMIVYHWERSDPAPAAAECETLP